MAVSADVGMVGVVILWFVGCIVFGGEEMIPAATL